MDDCNRSESPLSNGGFWNGTYDPDHTGLLTANGSVCIPGTSTNASAYTAGTYATRVRVSATAADGAGSGTNHFILGFLTDVSGTNTADGYICLTEPANANSDIRRITNGSSGTVLVSSGTTITTGNKFACQIDGTTISLWIETGSGWTKLLETTDATVSGPWNVAVNINTTQLSYDDIRAGTFTPVTSTSPVLFIFMQ